MQLAVIVDRTGLFEPNLPTLAGRDVDIPLAIPSGRRVHQRVLVDPLDGVANFRIYLGGREDKLVHRDLNCFRARRDG
jgi:hypothetical protein